MNKFEEFEEHMNRIVGLDGDGGKEQGIGVQVGSVEDKGVVVLKIGDSTFGFSVAQALLISRDMNSKALSMLFSEHSVNENREDDNKFIL